MQAILLSETKYAGHLPLLDKTVMVDWALKTNYSSHFVLPTIKDFSL